MNDPVSINKNGTTHANAKKITAAYIKPVKTALLRCPLNAIAESLTDI
jgi:hypothetical protein